MLDLIGKVFDKNTWLNLMIISTMIILAAIVLTSFLYFFPVEFQLSRKEIRDETYYLHNITYKSWSSIEEGHSTVVHLEIVDSMKKATDNLVLK